MTEPAKFVRFGFVGNDWLDNELSYFGDGSSNFVGLALTLFFSQDIKLHIFYLTIKNSMWIFTNNKKRQNNDKSNNNQKTKTF